MQHEQNVSDMVYDVLMRQARERVAWTGERLEEALDAILETEAGRKLSKLREGPHHAARAHDWQEDIAREREEEWVEYKRRRAQIRKGREGAELTSVAEQCLDAKCNGVCLPPTPVEETRGRN